MSSRARFEIKVHIGQTIRVFNLAIFLFAYFDFFFTLSMSPVNLAVFGTETISSDKVSIDISDTFKLLSSVKKIWRYLSDIRVYKNYIDPKW